MNIDIKANYQEDKNKQEKGSPCHLSDDSFILVRRFGTVQTTKELEKLKRRLFGFADKHDEQLLLGHWLAEHGVTGWEGIDSVGEEVEYSKSNALGIFTNPQYMLSLNQDLLRHATNYANYLHDDMCEDVENIKKS